MRLTEEDQAVVVFDAIRDCANQETGMAHLPDVVAVCVVAGMTRPNAYNVIARWNNKCWRRIGTSIGLIRVGQYD
jgi:hypothetical protein